MGSGLSEHRRLLPITELLTLTQAITLTQPNTNRTLAQTRTVHLRS